MDAVHPLRAYRERVRLTQVQLAQLLGVARETVARWETRTREPNRESMGGIFKKTGISPNELLGIGEAAE